MTTTVTTNNGHTLRINVPSHWKVVPLEAVLTDIIGGGTPSKTNPSYWKGPIPWLSIKDMRTRRPADAIDHISEEAVQYSSTNIIPADTVIIATRVGLGKIVRVPYDSAINQDLKALIAGPALDKSYLEYWMTSIADYLESIGSGTTVKGIRLEQLRSIPFPLAPLNEQKLIVAEIEKQFSRLDEAVANLKRVKANLKRYKAAVLKTAVEGRLVETEAALGRREGRNYETGTQLLKRLLEGRRRRWKGNGKYKEPAAPDTTDLLKLPEGWVWARLDTISTIIDSLHKTPPYVEGGYSMVRVTEVRGGLLDLSGALRVTEDVFMEFTRRYRPRRGDIVLSRVGTYGNASLVATVEPFCLGQNTAIIAESMIEPTYLHRCLESSVVRRQIDLAVVGSSQKTLSLKSISGLSIPVPSAAEQQMIVQDVDRRLSLVKAIEDGLDANLARAVRLRQAILKTAFSGSLVN